MNYFDALCSSDIPDVQLFSVVSQSTINYWCREKHYRHMQNAAKEGLTKYGNDPLLKYFYGYSLVLESESINCDLITSVC